MFVLVLAAAIAAAAVSVSQVVAAPSASPTEVLPGRYIVVLEDGATKPGKGGPAAVAKAYGVAPDLVYQSALRGFAAAASAKQAGQLAGDPRVASVEPDRVVRALAQTLPTGVDRVDADVNPIAAIGEDGDDVGVTVAVIDTGIDLGHPDLKVAAGLGTTCAGGKPTPGDQNGHGSHVAGSIGALDNGIGVVGVAPGASVVPVRVLGPNGSGSLSCIVAGIDHVTANADQIAVANMSLGWQGNSLSARKAIQGSVGKGVVYTVAAGNEDDDVYGSGGFDTGDEYEPASYPEVAAVSALADANGAAGGGGGSTSHGVDDSFATFSNYSASVVAGNPVTSPGKAIDLLLPGVDILSTYKDGGYATASGTSMASPHAAGLAALYVAANGRATDAAGAIAIRQALIDAGRSQASGLRLALPASEPDAFPEPLGWAGSATLNASPSAAAAPASTEEDTPVTVTLEGSDPESCELTFSVLSGPGSGSLGTISSPAGNCTGGEPNSDTASVEYTPNADFEGEDSFVFEVTDGDGASAEATATVTVEALNDPPSAVAVEAGGAEDAAEIAWEPSVGDPDGDTLSCSIPAGEGPSNGTAGVEADCSAGSYTPDPDFSGEDSFTYEVTDGALSDTATVSVSVEAVNDPPSVEAVSIGTEEDTPVTVTLAGSDPESCELTFSVLSGPASGSTGPVEDQACGAGDTANVEYTPNPDFNGEDFFTYEVSDGSASDTATVSVSVEAVNDPPLAAADSHSTPEGEALSVEAPGVLGNDTDVDGDSLTASLAGGPSNGVLTLNADGSFSYEPGPGFSGEDSFTYRASDGTADSNLATVAIAVEAAAPSGFLEDFEGDVSGWTASGLWHLANDTGCVEPGYTSATHSAYFGDESSCTYANRRKQVLGVLTSPSIAVSGATTLSFGSWREVESYLGGAFDRTWVEVSYDDGASWTTAWYRDSTNASSAEWTTESVPLSPPAEAEAAIVRFGFDTLDGVSNNHRGWLIDDVEVS